MWDCGACRQGRLGWAGQGQTDCSELSRGPCELSSLPKHLPDGAALCHLGSLVNWSSLAGGSDDGLGRALLPDSWSWVVVSSQHAGHPSPVSQGGPSSPW